MDAAFVALDPRDEAQAQVAALISDDLWKLERLGRIETNLTLARIEELLGLTQSAGQAGAITNAIASLGTALAALDDAPGDVGGLELLGRLRDLQDALELVDGTQAGITPDAMAACAGLLQELRRAANGGDPTEDALANLVQSARWIMAELLERGDRIEADQDGLRRAIATIAIPNEKELSKLARYRRMLEEGLQRRLQCLDQIRAVAATVDPAHAEEAKQYRVRLRLVK